MRIVGALACALVIGLASSAQAAQRYASPTGSGPAAECPQQNPCSLNDAVGKANSNDEVIVGGGTYAITTPISTDRPEVDIHGDYGGPPPRVTAALTGVLFHQGPRSRLSYLELSNSAEYPSALSCGEGSMVERVVVRASGRGAVAFRGADNCVVRESLITASGESAIGILASGLAEYLVTLGVNLTVIAAGEGSIGARSTFTEGQGPGTGGYELTFRNVIVQGEKNDLEANTAGSYKGKIIVSHSNFDKSVGGPEILIHGPGNQGAAPLYVDAVDGDFREAAGSPTIDAGAFDSQAGPLDLVGGARIQDGATDIGAYEYTPMISPLPLPAPAAQLVSLSLSPRAFVPADLGTAVLSSARRKPPATTTVAYGLSEAGRVAFTVERKTTGRRVGRRCVRRSRANSSKPGCPLYRRLNGGFSAAGGKGRNAFRFSGRLNGLALRPGRYRLVGSAGGVTKRTAFRILPSPG